MFHACAIDRDVTGPAPVRSRSKGSHAKNFALVALCIHPSMAFSAR